MKRAAILLIPAVSAVAKNSLPRHHFESMRKTDKPFFWNNKNKKMNSTLASATAHGCCSGDSCPGTVIFSNRVESSTEICDDFYCSQPCKAEPPLALLEVDNLKEQLSETVSSNGCQCFKGFAGDSCERMACDTDCCSDGLQCVDGQCADKSPSDVAHAFLTKLGDLQKDKKITNGIVVRAMGRLFSEMHEIKMMNKEVEVMSVSDELNAEIDAEEKSDGLKPEKSSDEAVKKDETSVSEKSNNNNVVEKSSKTEKTDNSKKSTKMDEKKAHAKIEEKTEGQKMAEESSDGAVLESPEEPDQMQKYGSRIPKDAMPAKKADVHVGDDDKILVHQIELEAGQTLMDFLGVKNQVATSFFESESNIELSEFDTIFDTMKRDFGMTGQCCNLPSSCDGNAFAGVVGICTTEQFFCSGSCTAVAQAERPVFMRIAKEFKKENARAREVARSCEAGIFTKSEETASRSSEVSTICAKSTSQMWNEIPERVDSLKRVTGKSGGFDIPVGTDLPLPGTSGMAELNTNLQPGFLPELTLSAGLEKLQTPGQLPGTGANFLSESMRAPSTPRIMRQLQLEPVQGTLDRAFEPVQKRFERRMQMQSTMNLNRQERFEAEEKEPTVSPRMKKFYKSNKPVNQKLLHQNVTDLEADLKSDGLDKTLNIKNFEELKKANLVKKQYEKESEKDGDSEEKKFETGFWAGLFGANQNIFNLKTTDPMLTTGLDVASLKLRGANEINRFSKVGSKIQSWMDREHPEENVNGMADSLYQEIKKLQKGVGVAESRDTLYDEIKKFEKESLPNH